jgi:pimeloyl-ACP methyl ester carboxylesterase
MPRLGWVEALARRHRVTAVDRPGFGGSQARGDDATLTELAALAPRYPTLAVPAVVIWCDQDAFNGRAVASARLARELPQAREVPLPR